MTVGNLTAIQVRSGLKDRESLVRFLNDGLGYKINPVFYNDPCEELGIARYLTREVSSWWLLSHYPGRLPFQIHFVQITELPGFNLCRDIVESFRRRRPGYFLFLFTKDYCHVLFFTIELSLERRPFTWLRLPKSYPRYLLVDRANPTSTQLQILAGLKVESSEINPAALHKKVLEALKSTSRHDDLPCWFLSSWYYRLGFSQNTYDNLRKSGKI